MGWHTEAAPIPPRAESEHCADGGPAPCCAASAACCRLVGVGGGGDGGPDGARMLRVHLSREMMARLSEFGLAQAPSTHRWRASAGTDAGRWMRMWAAQGCRRSAEYLVRLIDGSALRDGIERRLRQLSPAQRAALGACAPSEQQASAPMLEVARHVAAKLLDGLPEPADREGAPPGAGAVRTMLVVVNIDTMRRRRGADAAAADDAAGQLLDAWAWPLASSAVLAVLCDHPKWHVHLAPNETAALAFVQALMRVCERAALLRFADTSPTVPTVWNDLE